MKLCYAIMICFMCCILSCSGCSIGDDENSTSSNTEEINKYRNPFFFDEKKELIYFVSIISEGTEKIQGTKQRSEQSIIYKFEPIGGGKAKLLWTIKDIKETDYLGNVYHAQDLPPQFEFGIFMEDGSYQLTQGQGTNEDIVIDMKYPKIPIALSATNSSVSIEFKQPTDDENSKMLIGEKKYIYMGESEIYGQHCKKFVVKVDASTDVQPSKNGYVKLSITTTAYFSEEVGNYLDTTSLFFLENRIINKDWDIDMHTCQKQKIHIQLKDTIAGGTDSKER